MLFMSACRLAKMQREDLYLLIIPTGTNPNDAFHCSSVQYQRKKERIFPLLSIAEKGFRAFVPNRLPGIRPKSFGFFCINFFENKPHGFRRGKGNIKSHRYIREKMRTDKNTAYCHRGSAYSYHNI